MMADKDLAAALGYTSDGGIVDALFGDITIPARVNQNIARQGAKTRARIQAQRQAQEPAFYDQAIPMEGRATFLPFRVSPTGQKSFAMPGLFAGAINAVTAPGRALRGTDPTFNPEQEAFDVALNTMGMGGAVGRAPAGSLGMNVYHGSPHRFAPTAKNPLGEFDASKIGTGEGAQAYGHGLYLAESPDVAKSYGDTLSQYRISTRDGVKSGRDFEDALVANAGDYPASLSSAIRSQANKIATDLAGGKTAEQVTASMRSGPYARMYSGLADAVEKMSPTKAGGSLYKVDLPDNQIAKMLDWDKPLSGQSKEVQSAMAKFYGVGLDDFKKMMKLDPDKFDKSGQQLVNDIAGRLNVRNPSPVSGGAQASNYLKDAGIPGIRYLDQGSRNTSAGELIGVAKGADGWKAKIRKTPSGQLGDVIPMAPSITTSKSYPTEQAARDWANSQIGGGTSNYVVFPGEESSLRILERNGVPAQPTSVEYLDPFRDTTR